VKNLKQLITTILVVLIIFVSSCKKEGTGGKSSIKGRVMHHIDAIPAATIYIKYGAIDFPGTNVSTYDAQVTADAQGAYKFEGLQKGDYYLYGIGYDTAVVDDVMGGVAVKVRKNEDIVIDVAVRE